MKGQSEINTITKIALGSCDLDVLAWYNHHMIWDHNFVSRNQLIIASDRIKTTLETVENSM
jgi:hypothetical protein